MKKERFSIALSKDLKKWIDEQAAQDSRSRSGYIEKILQDHRAEKLSEKNDYT